MQPLRVTLVALLGLLASCAAAAPHPYGEPHLVCRFADPKIAECSGIVASSHSDGVFFVHNDSGAGPYVYALDRKGRTLAALRLKGAFAFDWEDIARGPGEGGKPSLFLADTGDNFRIRAYVSIYRIPEPEVDPAREGVAAETAPAVRFDLEYPDGPHDAETLLVHPRTGRIFIVTKSKDGSGVYAAPADLKPGAKARLGKVADIPFPRLAPGGAADSGALLATGGAISPDGARVVIRTYSDAYEWSIANGDLAAAFKTDPIRIPMPDISGGEAITYSRDGRSLLAASEGKSAPIYEYLRH